VILEILKNGSEKYEKFNEYYKECKCVDSTSPSDNGRFSWR
jgi:hypothetical protein